MSDPFAVYGPVASASPSRRAAGYSSAAGKASPAKAFGGDAQRSSSGNSRPNSRGGGSHQWQPSGSLNDRSHGSADEDGLTGRSHGGRASLHTSREGLGTRSSSKLASSQSPYLQPPSGRSSSNARPSSRQVPPSQHHTALHQSLHAPAGFGSHGSGSTSLRSSMSSVAGVGALGSGGMGGQALASSSGARLFQAYGMSPRSHSTSKDNSPVQANHAGSYATGNIPAQPHPRSNAFAQSADQQQAQRQPQGVSPPHQAQIQGHAQVHGQQQAAPAAVAMQQLQNAGPRATTAVSGPRSAQRVRQEDVVSAQRLGVAAATGMQRPYGSGQAGSGAGPHGTARDPEMSFGYDDIPEEEDESGSPDATNIYSGLTLDQYMQRMITTPASAAATSGLGADDEGSTPRSPGAGTEEDDTSPYNSLAYGARATIAAATATAMAMMADTAGGEHGGSAQRALSARRMLQCSSANRIMPGSSNGIAAGQSASASGGTPGSGVAMPRLTGTGVPVSPSHRSTSGAAGAFGEGASPRSLPGGASTDTGQRRASGSGNPLAAARSSARGSVGHGGGAFGEPFSPGSGSLPLDVAALLEDSSGDERASPSVRMPNSIHHANRLSTRASAMAFSNSLDLRPATAAAISSPSSLARGDPMHAGMGHRGGRGGDVDLDVEHHSGQAQIRQVDLGGLSASLFTPTNSSQTGVVRDSMASPAPTGGNGSNSSDGAAGAGPSGASSPDVAAAAAGRRMAAAAAQAAVDAHGPASPAAPLVWGPGAGGGSRPLASPKGAIPPPWGVSAREGALGGPDASVGNAAGGSLQALAARPLSSRGRPTASAATPPTPALTTGAGGEMAAAGAAAAGSRAWASKQQPTGKGSTAASPLDDLPHEARLLAAEAQGLARPPTRQVQSARPPGCRGEMELDPSVWQANIAMQLQRPPSRQKPPPEALHLWTPEQQINMLAAGALGRNSSGRPIGRPQSAAPTAYRSTRPTSGLRVKAQGHVGEDAAAFARPPSRQKPPPMSVLLEHDDFPPPPPAAVRRGQRPGAEQLAVVVSDSEDGMDSDLSSIEE